MACKTCGESTDCKELQEQNMILKQHLAHAQEVNRKQLDIHAAESQKLLAEIKALKESK
jgi:hypothetical protein